MHTDQGVWATAGMAINSDKVFFKDYKHFNLPGLGFSYAIALDLVDSPQEASMLVNLAGSILIISGIYLLLGLTVNKIAAAWAVLIFSILWPTHILHFHIAQKDFMAAFGLLLGTWLSARAVTKSKWQKSSIFLSGLMVGISIMYKPVFGITLILLAMTFILRFIFASDSPSPDDKMSLYELIRNLALLTAGTMTVALLFLIYLYQGDALSDCYNGVFVFAPIYAQISRLPVFQQIYFLLVHSFMLCKPFDNLAIVHLLLWLLILLIGFGSLFKKGFVKMRLWLSIPFTTALFTYFIQGKSFGYYNIPWKLCLIMTAGCGLSYLYKQFENNPGRSELRKAVIFTLFIVLIFGRCLLFSQYARVEVPVWQGKIDRGTYLKRYFNWVKDAEGYPSDYNMEKLGHWIKENSLPHEKILVWGLGCQLYALSERLYATHSPFDLILTSNLRQSPKARAWQKTLREEFITQLAEEKPRFIVLLADDFTPVESISSKEAVKLIPGFQTLLNNTYAKEFSLDKFEIYRLKTDKQ
jgi:hypothetical protein